MFDWVVWLCVCLRSLVYIKVHFNRLAENRQRSLFRDYFRYTAHIHILRASQQEREHTQDFTLVCVPVGWVCPGQQKPELSSYQQISVPEQNKTNDPFRILQIIL